MVTQSPISPWNRRIGGDVVRWKEQALIDVGVRDSVPSVESDEFASARVRVAALEAELVLTREACACSTNWQSLNYEWCDDCWNLSSSRKGLLLCGFDCFSKMIVGRSLSTTTDTELANKAVSIAAQERIRWEATVLHADYGPQFTA